MQTYSDLSSSLMAVDFPRDTLVVEATFPEPVGSSGGSERKIEKYLMELGKIIDCGPIRVPVTHLSPKYGLSGWAPLENGAALHLYAWDEEGRERPSFISVDISTSEPLSNRLQVVDHLRRFVGSASGATVFKTLRSSVGENARTWRELAGHIVRQRLAIVGKPSAPIEGQEVQSYLRELCGVLRMDKLSDPLIQDCAAWMHWETSGAVASWKRDVFAIDIYTCKTFHPADAIEWTRRALSLERLAFKEF